ncbi:MAG TPA: OmpA family protein [Steroidobacteraceae bacterium]|nr:OmpA family protein [Steroidobacteraceae bacterium]
MKTAYSRIVCTMGLLGMGAAALAAENKPAPPQEPAGFITGGVIGGFAAGPIGAVVGAGIGTWLGNRVHRAGEAAKAEAQVAALQKNESELRTENAALLTEKGDLAETNRALTARLDQLSHSIEAAQSATDEVAQGEAAKVLDGLQGDVLFRTGSAEIAPEMANGLHVLAEAVAKSPALKVRVDGYADARGTVDANLKLSEARANAVRDLFVAAGVDEEALEINAYGKSQSVAADADGYALERRVRLTLQAQEQPAVAQSGGSGLPKQESPIIATPATSLQVTENE